MKFRFSLHLPIDEITWIASLEKGQISFSRCGLDCYIRLYYSVSKEVPHFQGSYYYSCRCTLQLLMIEKHSEMHFISKNNLGSVLIIFGLHRRQTLRKQTWFIFSNEIQILVWIIGIDKVLRNENPHQTLCYGYHI